MVFITQESAGRSGESSRLRDKLLLFNARTRLSQQGVASFVGVSTAALRNWEAGQSKPTAQNLKRLIELYVAYKAFAEGEEQTEAADLWEAAQERGLKVPFDEQWFQELLENQRSLHREFERERQPEQQYESGQEPEQVHTHEGHQESDAEASDNRSSKENEIALLSQAPEKLLSSSTHKLSRRTVVVGLTCLVVGGAAGSSLTWAALRSQTQLLHQSQWTQTGNMLLARGFFRATVLPNNGQVLIAGGIIIKGNLPTDQSELFDPIAGTWGKTQGSLNEARAKHTATLLPNGMVLVTGGLGTKTTLSSAELYDPKTETWSLKKYAMKYARARHTATMLPSRKVLIVGGAPYYPAELYDSNTDSWSLSGNMVTRRYDHVAVGLDDGTVLVAGGRTRNGAKNDDSSITNSAELYEPKTNTWIPLPNMNIPRADFTAVLLPHGRVMVIGGRLKNGDVTPTTEFYTPNASSWLLGAKINYARQNPLGQEAVQSEYGTILVVGGDTLRTSERYILSTDKWVSVPGLHSRHYLGATAALSNGQALVVGGFNILSTVDKKELTASAEIYFPGSE
jgi:transcriptional regulator with XRE-family HTH domain